MIDDRPTSIERLAARLGLTEGQLWTVAILAITIVLLLWGLRNLDTGAV